MAEVTVPAALLAAVGDAGAGRLALVIGAGCSFESPTDLPLSKPLATEADRQLRLNGVLQDGDCADPTDLSSVGDAVFLKLARQRELVDVLPKSRMRHARPNLGSLVAAALLLERVVSHVVVLNYDLSLTNALTELGAQGEVQVLRGPEDHGSMGQSNVVFLHRNVDADPETWVIRTETLDAAWKSGWEEVIARMVLGMPVIVFAGLGTRVGVLMETVKLIRDSLPAESEIVAVDPCAPEESVYAKELDLADDHFVRSGWGDFMDRLARRLVAEHRADLRSSCAELHETQGLDDTNADFLCDQAEALGLLRLGELRAEWLLSSRRYMPAAQSNAALIADLLLVVGTLETNLDAVARLGGDGLVEFWKDDRLVAVVRLASGQGVDRWLALEQRVRNRDGRAQPTFAVVSGFTGPAAPGTPPSNVIRGDPVGKNVATGESVFHVLAADDVRQNPAIVAEVIAA